MALGGAFAGSEVAERAEVPGSKLPTRGEVATGSEIIAEAPGSKLDEVSVVPTVTEKEYVADSEIL